ncbi:MAG: EamA family transporter RarD [Hylemonella sp.]|uniref:EamA family transporter RarD n=1 Tax=Hylemonella sp. TaxID=2066020 RepID=UPI0022BB9881|nr:EamA family transporter RarD [Hylemonella sp.]MCZ8251215.1 EamA family transporter RarD [Hylemonella sp.]
MSPVARGVALSVLASVLFGAMYYLSALLAPLSGEQIFGWRMLLTVPLLALFLRWSGDWQLVRATTERLRHEPVLWLVLPASAALLGVQLWLFLWAPPNGRALEVSLGYFMLPLSMVLAGRWVYGERLTRLQQLAVGCAAAGVLHELWRVAQFSWPAAVVVIGYPLYFLLRRHYRTDHLGGLWFDLLFMLPPATAFALSAEGIGVYMQRPLLGLLVPLLGIISASALVSYILSSRLLPLGLFGLLGYVEPMLLVAVALLLGERIATGQVWTYGPIWLAVGLLLIEGLRRLRRR